ncbi:hypothetical protein BGZ60DRAFT_428882 [Tricladium varicosporioides]|nr:hypothetical protein BGZ60DRAFT_428882 [Hymenoscyphus varicosporioides]
MSKYILYDLPSKGRCACWSLNPWKTRLALNYKNIPYETQWVEYPDIKSVLSPHVPPNPPNSFADYTIPTMQFPPNNYIMDSRAIATHLESLHPPPQFPSLHLDSPYLSKVEAILPKVTDALRGVWTHLAPYVLLNEPSREYFVRTREARIGKSLDEFRKEKGGEEAWIEASVGLKELGTLLGEEEGPFFMGGTPSYADFVVVGFLQFQKVIDERFLERLVKIEPTLGKLYDACKPWLERDNY